MKVIFSHGKESGPWGSKIKRLATISQAQNFEVESIDYSDISDPDIRVGRLIAYIEKQQDNYLLVGSSMGGYVSLVASEQVEVQGLFLLAPALYMPNYERQIYTAPNHTEIVHGWSDDVIPAEHSIRFAKQADCPLHLISGDHRLNASIEVVADLFARFLVRLRQADDT